MYLNYRKNYFSQNGEDGIIEKLIEELNLGQNLFVCEFGAWDGFYLSNTFHLVIKYNATALMIEGDDEKYKELLKTSKKNTNIIPINKFVVPNGDNSLDKILEQNNFPIDFDVLSIDIDGNDLEIWESLTIYKPKIVIIEINSNLTPDINQIHNPKLGLKGNSFKSTLEVSKKKGYFPIAHTGNLILLKKELLEKIKFDENLLKNPEKIFIYDWINKKKVNNYLIIKLLKSIIPKFIRRKISVRLKVKFYNYLK
jgi:hypothetical protein